MYCCGDGPPGFNSTTQLERHLRIQHCLPRPTPAAAAAPAPAAAAAPAPAPAPPCGGSRRQQAMLEARELGGTLSLARLGAARPLEGEAASSNPNPNPTVPLTPNP